MLKSLDVTSAEVIGEFSDQVQTCLNTISERMEELDKLKEAESTKAHNAAKIIDKFFHTHGQI